MSKISKNLLISLFLLLAAGLMILSSAGVAQSQRNFNQSYYYFWHQFLYGVLPGLALFFIASKIKPEIWKKFSLPLLLLSMLVLILVFIPGIGISAKGASRWVDAGLFSFQPSEILKLTMILYLAAWFSKNISSKGVNSASLVPFILILGFIALILAVQPDIGTMIAISAIAFIMFFVAGAKFKHIFVLAAVGFMLLLTVVYLAPYRWQRLVTFINPNQDIKGASYHLNQSLISIGSGGLTGVGYGESKQKLGLLPEPIGDSIFAVAAEEFGFVGSAVILGLYLFLISVLIKISLGVQDRFSQLFVLGMAGWIGVQAIVNIGAISGLLPLTGIPLPFISYGGTSMISLLTGLGIVYRISKE